MKITTTLATCLTPDGGTMSLMEHDNQHYLKVGGIQLMSTTASFSEQQMAVIACAKLPEKPRVLIGGLGFGFTLRRVLELCSPNANVVVAELLPQVIDWNRQHLAHVNGLLLDDPRVEIFTGDVGKCIEICAKKRYHAILLDVDNSPDPLVQKGNAQLYNRGGIARTHAALHVGGRVVFWSANADKDFARSLERIFQNVECISAKAYPKAKRFSHTLFVADRLS